MASYSPSGAKTSRGQAQSAVGSLPRGTQTYKGGPSTVFSRSALKVGKGGPGTTFSRKPLSQGPGGPVTQFGSGSASKPKPSAPGKKNSSGNARKGPSTKSAGKAVKGAQGSAAGVKRGSLAI